MQIPKRLEGSWWDIPLSMDELKAVTPVSSPIARDLQLTPWEMLQEGLLFIGDDNSIILPTTAEGPKRSVLEDNSSSINVQTSDTRSNTSMTVPSKISRVGLGGAASTPANNASLLITAIPIVLVGGSLANVPVIPALAGFYGVINPFAIWGDTADVYTLTFQDEDDVALHPQIMVANQIEIKGNNEISPFSTTHGAAGDNSGSPPKPVVLWGASDNKAIEVDVTGGAGTEELVLFVEYYWN